MLKNNTHTVDERETIKVFINGCAILALEKTAWYQLNVGVTGNQKGFQEVIC